MRTISIEDARKQLYEILDEISESRQPVAIESEGERLGVLLDPRDYARMKRVVDSTLERAKQAIDEVRALNADKDPDEVYRVVTEVVEEVRQEQHEQRKASTSHRR